MGRATVLCAMSCGGTANSTADAFFNALDANHDGVVSRAEFNQASIATTMSLPPQAPHGRCVCGEVFLPDAAFCRKCGVPRPMMSVHGCASPMPSGVGFLPSGGGQLSMTTPGALIGASGGFPPPIPMMHHVATGPPGQLVVAPSSMASAGTACLVPVSVPRSVTLTPFSSSTMTPLTPIGHQLPQAVPRGAPSMVPPMEPVTLPMASAGIDINGDGHADLLVVGVDANRDGIPDVMQRSMPRSPANAQFACARGAQNRVASSPARVIVPDNPKAPRSAGVQEAVTESQRKLEAQVQGLAAKVESLVKLEQDRLTTLDAVHVSVTKDREAMNARLAAFQSGHAEELRKLQVKSKEDISNLGQVLERLESRLAQWRAEVSSETSKEILKQVDIQLGGANRGSSSDVEFLKKAHGKHVSSTAERLDYLEKVIGDSASRHTTDLAALKSAHDRHSVAFNKHVRDFADLKGGQMQHSTIEERLRELERFTGDSADKHSRELEALRKAHGKHSQDYLALKETSANHGTLAERLESIEMMMEKQQKKSTALEDQLRVSCYQTDQITATLHKEVIAKENLVDELREAYDDLKKLSPKSLSMGGGSRSASATRLTGIGSASSLTGSGRSLRGFTARDPPFAGTTFTTDATTIALTPHL